MALSPAQMEVFAIKAKAAVLASILTLDSISEPYLFIYEDKPSSDIFARFRLERHALKGQLPTTDIAVDPKPDEIKILLYDMNSVWGRRLESLVVPLEADIQGANRIKLTWMIFMRELLVAGELSFPYTSLARSQPLAFGILKVPAHPAALNPGDSLHYGHYSYNWSHAYDLLELAAAFK